MLQNKKAMEDTHSSSQGRNSKKQENSTNHFSRDIAVGSDIWTDGLICAFEFVRGHKRSTRLKPGSKINSAQKIEGKDSKKQVLRSDRLLHSASLMDIESTQVVPLDDCKESDDYQTSHLVITTDKHAGSYWVPIGWARLDELVKCIQVNAGWDQEPIEFLEDEDDLTVQDVAAPYWERAAGPTWWCHVSAGHPYINTWLSNAQWLHPAVRIGLKDESQLISERMKHLLYEVPVRVAGGLLFELLGQSAGDPFVNEDDIPVVVRSWQAQNFLITALHVKGFASKINILGITEVQELLSAGGVHAPKTIHEVIAHLASRLSRWDDRLFRKSIFGTADEIELKFMDRRNHEDMNLFSIILNQEIRWLSKQVIRVKWSLHAREEIVFELLQHLKGSATKNLLEGIKKNTREMIEEQEAVRGRLFTIQDVMQSTVRAWLQDRSLRVTHNLAVFGGCGLVLSIITGLFGINVDGIPGASNTPYAFGLFSAILLVIGISLICIGIVYLGLKTPMMEQQVEVRKLELDKLVEMFQHDAETHAQVKKEYRRKKLSPTAADMVPNGSEC